MTSALTSAHHFTIPSTVVEGLEDARVLEFAKMLAPARDPSNPRKFTAKDLVWIRVVAKYTDQDEVLQLIGPNLLNIKATQITIGEEGRVHPIALGNLAKLVHESYIAEGGEAGAPSATSRPASPLDVQTPFMDLIRSFGGNTLLAIQSFLTAVPQLSAPVPSLLLREGVPLLKSRNSRSGDATPLRPITPGREGSVSSPSLSPFDIPAAALATPRNLRVPHNPVSTPTSESGDSSSPGLPLGQGGKSIAGASRLSMADSTFDDRISTSSATPLTSRGTPRSVKHTLSESSLRNFGLGRKLFSAVRSAGQGSASGKGSGTDPNSHHPSRSPSAAPSESSRIGLSRSGYSKISPGALTPSEVLDKVPIPVINPNKDGLYTADGVREPTPKDPLIGRLQSVDKLELESAKSLDYWRNLASHAGFCDLRICSAKADFENGPPRTPADTSDLGHSPVPTSYGFTDFGFLCERESHKVKGWVCATDILEFRSEHNLGPLLDKLEKRAIERSANILHRAFLQFLDDNVSGGSHSALGGPTIPTAAGSGAQAGTSTDN